MEQNANYQLTTISQLRNIISQKKKWVQSIRGKDELQVIIRGAEGASFSNVVDIIDECHIAAVKRYYFDELNPQQRLQFN